MYLMVQSPGEAPVESFTLLGASTSRSNPSAIGQFGTGNKLAITLLLRHNYNVRVYCGKTKLVFGSRKIDFNGQEEHRVTVAINGKKPVDCGWTLSWGGVDWTDVSMAMREFVANALDASDLGRGYESDLASKDLVVTTTDTVKAKTGFTRVFVEYVDGIVCFHEELPQRFLHFSHTPFDRQLLEKEGRSLSKNNSAMVYRQGVFVCELSGESIYDYNLSDHEITIDECRNSNEYSVRASIARRIRRATAEELTPILQAIGDRRQVLETRLDPEYLLPAWETPTDEQITQWQIAWKIAFKEAVMTGSDARSLKYVQCKGYRAQSVDSSQWRAIMSRLGIKVATDVLSPSEAIGRVKLGVSVKIACRIQKMWELFEKLQMTKGHGMPGVGCFTDTDNEINYYLEGGSLYIREGLNEPGKAILGGLAEYACGSDSTVGANHDYLIDFLEKVLNDATRML